MPRTIRHQRGNERDHIMWTLNVVDGTIDDEKQGSFSLPQNFFLSNATRISKETRKEMFGNHRYSFRKHLLELIENGFACYFGKNPC